MRTAAAAVATSNGVQNDVRSIDYARSRPLRAKWVMERPLALHIAAVFRMLSGLLVALDIWDNGNLFDPERVSYLAPLHVSPSTVHGPRRLRSLCCERSPDSHS